MKASEVLKEYQAGERNFQRVNLRGQSFKGANLADADFSKADIRGTKFTGANLRGAKFCGAKCGLRRFETVFLVIMTCGVAIILDSFSLIFFAPTILILESNSEKHSVVLITLFATLIYFIPLEIKAKTVSGVSIFVLLGLFFIAAIKVNHLVLAVATLLGALGFAVAGSIFLAEVLVVALLATDSKLGLVLTSASKIVGIIFLFQIVEEVENIVRIGSIFSLLVATLVGIYIFWKTLQKDEKFTWVLSRAIDFASTPSTSFYKANLTDANFNGAILKSANLRKAILTRVNWLDVHTLDYIRSEEAYLKNKLLKEVLITGKGQNKDFDRLDLRGINLQGANLKDASFIGTDLSEANLKDAKLCKAKLVKTQLDGTDLTGATLTGACIENWGINNQTKLDDVTCDYVYLKEDKQECLPHNRNFKPGEFAKYVEKALNTVDLIFTDGIDWSAFLKSFEELQDEYGAENLGVQAIERKSDSAFVVRIEVPPDANKAAIESRIEQSYKIKLQGLEAEYRKNLKAKDKEIEIYKEKSADMLEIAKLAASRPINVYQVQGNNMVGNRKIEISGNAQVNASGAGAFNLGEINGTVANTINELPSSSNPNQPGIKDLLTQLQTAVEDPNLSADDKKQTLEQLQVLAEAGQNPQDASMQKKAKKAVGILKVIAEAVEPATKLAKACAQVLPKILLFFGI